MNRTRSLAALVTSAAVAIGSLAAAPPAAADHGLSRFDVRVGHIAQAEGTGPVRTTTAFTFTITLDEPAHEGGERIAYRTEDTIAACCQVALPHVDYTPVAGTLAFAPGERSRTVTVPVAADGIPETDEFFVFQLLAGDDDVVTWAMATINDDDALPLGR